MNPFDAAMAIHSVVSDIRSTASALQNTMPQVAVTFLQLADRLDRMGADVCREWVDAILEGKTSTARTLNLMNNINVLRQYPGQDIGAAPMDFSFNPPMLQIDHDDVNETRLNSTTSLRFLDQCLWPLRVKHLAGEHIATTGGVIYDKEKGELSLKYGHPLNAFETTVTIPLIDAGLSVSTYSVLEDFTICVKLNQLGIHWVTINMIYPVWEVNDINREDVREIPQQTLIDRALELDVNKEFKAYNEMYFDVKHPNGNTHRLGMKLYDLHPVPNYINDNVKQPVIRFLARELSGEDRHYMGRKGQWSPDYWEDLPAYYQRQIVEQFDHVFRSAL